MTTRTVELDRRRGVGWGGVGWGGGNSRVGSSARDQTIHVPIHITPRNTTEKRHDGDDIESFALKLI